MKIKFNAPTETFPFYSNVKIKTASGWQRVIECPTDGRPNGPALFPTKEEMVRKVKRLAKAA